MIDWDRVMSLREEVGADDFLEVAEMFLSEVGEVLDRLTTGMNANTLEGDFHFLKGAALNLGFADFAELCRNGEAQSKASNFGSIDMPGVVTCFNASSEAFVSGLAQRMAS